MSNKPIMLTVDGYKKLETELEQLTTVKRREVAEKIKDARAFGDISENAEYDEAKKEQAEIEARINKLESILKNAEVVSADNVDMNKVSVGTLVKVFDFEFDEEVEYTLVGATEADPFDNKISNDSPIGAALLGKSVGETVEIIVPQGVSKLKILEIRR